MIDGHIPNLLCRTSSIYPSRFTFLPLFSALRLSAILHGPHRWDPIALCLLGRVFISQLLSFEITRYVFEAESVLWPKIITLQDNFPYTTLSDWIYWELSFLWLCSFQRRDNPFLVARTMSLLLPYLVEYARWNVVSTFINCEVGVTHKIYW